MTQVLHFTVTLLICTHQAVAFNGNSLMGKLQYCNNEGAPVIVFNKLIGTNPCHNCFCKNHIVQCNAIECPSVEGCYKIERKRDGQCCHTCSSCLHNGTSLVHKSLTHDNCQIHQCEAGILTSSDTQCYVPCSNPVSLKQDECCPHCRGCWLEGKLIPENGSGNPRHDPCVNCICKNGYLSCKKRTCPVLSCPPYKAIPEPDGCCLRCNGSRNSFRLQNKRCFLGTKLYSSGDTNIYDQCTNCTCSDGFLTCQRQTCPILLCPKQYQQVKEAQCCAECVYPALSRVCVKDGILREHNDTWYRNQCTLCHCQDGVVTCETEHCKYANKDCPPHFNKVQKDIDCCPKCKERPGICVTYGDPHYKTFDGYKFNFQGECKYELASDCKGKTFSIRVNNDARKSSYFSWTRSLSFRMEHESVKYKVSLGQKLRVRVNKKRVKLPFEKDALNITKNGFSLTVATSIGVKITWNGASYVEIQVDPKWKNRTCGLCGNFNRNATDDKTDKKGDLALTDEDMANSWQSGKTSSCSKRLKRLRQKEKENETRFQRLSCFKPLMETKDQCKILNNTYFDACRKKVPTDDYYKSCLLDLCECPTGCMCECDAVLAYIRECKNAGVDVSEWKTVSQCGGFECPYWAMFTQCAPDCKLTCKNPRPNVSCLTRRCKPGCYCPPMTVLHRGTCIVQDKCPKRRKQRRH